MRVNSKTLPICQSGRALKKIHSSRFSLSSPGGRGTPRRQTQTTKNDRQTYRPASVAAGLPGAVGVQTLGLLAGPRVAGGLRVRLGGLHVGHHADVVHPDGQHRQRQRRLHVRLLPANTGLTSHGVQLRGKTSTGSVSCCYGALFYFYPG